MLLICKSVFSQCPPGDVYLLTQEDVINFIEDYPNCETILGDLVISYSANDISNLKSVKRIEGSLIIESSEITSVTNFQNLEFILENIYLENNRSLVTIEGINKLSVIGGDFVIFQPGPLKNIGGFDSLETIEGNLYIEDNFRLESITGFENLSSINGSLSISDNLNLISIPEFKKLSAIGRNLTIEDNIDLPSINSFNFLKKIGQDLIIQFNYLLVSVQGFRNLNTVQGKILFHGSKIRSIPSFSKLETIGSSLEIDDTSLTDINGFNNVIYIGGAIDTSQRNIHIHQNTLLTVISGFQKLTKLQGGLDITNNEKLISLIGFSNLSTTGILNISFNESITSLLGLESLSKVGVTGGSAILLRDNILLTDCAALCNLLTNGTVFGDINIFGNPSACLTKSEIIENCPNDFDEDGVTNDIDLDDDNDGILDVVEQAGLLDRDTDNDNFPDYRDLNSDNDGCLDVIEAGFSDGDQDGVLGSLPVSVDLNGLVIGVFDGYTTPLDADGNGVFDFQQDSSFDIGENGSVVVCIYDAPIDLFNSLMGTPDAGGDWSPTLTSETGLFDPAIDSGGVYKYTFLSDACSGFSEVSVDIKTELPVAGGDEVLKVCYTDDPIDLFDVLLGDPDSGGVWSPELTSGTGVFDPIIDDAGVYIYTISYGLCGSDSSQVEVQIETLLPNAGTDSELEICIRSQPVDLFDSLLGNPDSGGVWSPQPSSGTGVFDPLIDEPGLYSYSVGLESSCATVSSTVEVKFIELFKFYNYTIKTKGLSDNNSIEIFVNSPIEYEYSIDGINYQSSSIFNNLLGGEYTVFGREKNGCGWFEELVSILYFPRFFTPNNDGVNDFWNLAGDTDLNYSLYIYDRYGRLLKLLTSSNRSWDGNYNGISMPSNDYWFRVIFSDGVSKNGHFTLKR
ncbi:T9SS type B sorting domain-containing protein [Thalassobellus sediminis]|uniref:T9SS type B sorting domain-containing protein n=1 Tax=Thalassobellus sediminis TaxID=3367753 RepID=UPI003791A1AD